MAKEDLQAHYGLLLRLTGHWSVKDVRIDLEALTLTIEAGYAGREIPCPVPGCGRACAIRDHRKERSWRHLDTMQFETDIKCRVPRVDCRTHGVKTAAVPWAGPRSQFTLLFECFAVDVLLGARSIRKAQEILRISWDQAHRIQTLAVERGLARRRLDELKHVGMDEKSFGRGQSYVSVMTDLDHGRVLDVTPDRTTEAANELWQRLPEEQRREVEGVALDMWEPYMSAARENAPQAAIVHDKFHVSKYLGKAVDDVRKKEHRELTGAGSGILKGTKYLWLMRPDRWNERQQDLFHALRREGLKVGRAWAIKEAFSGFWNCAREETAEQFFRRWFNWATHSQLKPVVEVAKTLQRHLAGLLTYLRHRITNAVTEGLNSKIQTLKSNARGFRNFEHYRISILFHCGKLKLHP